MMIVKKNLIIYILIYFTIIAGHTNRSAFAADQKAITPTISNEYNLQFSVEEQLWLKQNHVVRARVGKAPPWHFFDETFKGISVDYLDLIAKRAGFQVKYISDISWSKALEYIKNHEKIDLLLTAKITKERQQFIAFTDNYLLTPWVIFTRTDAGFIGGMPDLSHKTVSVERGYVMHGKLLKEFPDINLLVVESSQDAIEVVATGKAYAHIGNLTSTTYIIQKNNLNNVKIASPAPFENHNQAMAVRDDWPELASIINKTLKTMTTKEHAAIRNHWLAVRYDHGLRKADLLKWILLVSVFSLAIVMAILFWNRKLKKEVLKRQESEINLQKSEARLKEAQRIARIGNWELDLISNALYWSDEVYRIFDLQPRQFRASYEGFLENIHPEDRAMADKAYADSLKDKVPYDIVHRLLLKDGTIKFVNEHCETFYDDSGKAVRSIGTIQDITEHKQVKNSLHKARLFNKTLLDTSPDLIYVYDIIDRKSIYSNQGIVKILGYSVQEIQEMGENILPGLMHPDDFNNYLAKIIPRYQTAGDGEIIEHEYRMKHKDGNWAWLQSKELIFIRTADGLPKQIFGITTDITHRKQSEKIKEELLNRFNKIATHIQGVIYQYHLKTDGSSCFPYASTGIHNIYGVSPEQVKEDATPVFEVLHPDDIEKVSQSIAESADNLSVWYSQYRVNLPSGKTIWVEGNATPQKLKDGSILWHGYIDDITNRKNIEKALQTAYDEMEIKVDQRTKELTQANIRLQELDRLKSMFIASMSHELRTPLNSIIGFTGLILQGISGKIDAEATEDLNIVYTSSKHLLGLINDVIDISKIEADKLDIYFEYIKIVDVVEEILSIVSKDAEKKNLKIKTELPSGLTIISDKRRLFQCILNLMSNAIKFTEKGSIKLTVEKTEGQLKISVADTGIGIKKEDLSKLFKSFIRLETPLKEEVAGTGLGLYLTQKIMSNVFRGEIGLKSQYGKGSIFTLKIPLKQNIEQG